MALSMPIGGRRGWRAHQAVAVARAAFQHVDEAQVRQHGGDLGRIDVGASWHLSVAAPAVPIGQGFGGTRFADLTVRHSQVRSGSRRLLNQ